MIVAVVVLWTRRNVTMTVQSTMPLELVSTDLLGAISPASLAGARYAAKFSDYHTHCKAVYMIKTQGDAIATL